MAEVVAVLSDDELRAAALGARDDCVQAAQAEPNSCWHQACFAACIVYGQEIVRRGIRIEPTELH